MDKALILMLAMATPAPFRAAPSPPRRPKAVLYEKGPTWGKDPVRVARFGGNLDVQMAAQKFGMERHKAYVEQMGKFRVPIVGQVQQSTGISRSFSSNVR